MAFKKMETVISQRDGNRFKLEDDKDSAKVIPIYHSYDEVLVAECHYIKTDEYTGYVHCLGDGCPACQKGVKVQYKLFVPLYAVAELNPNKYSEDQVLFWDRNSSFDHQLRRDMFKKYDNPSEVIFEITRNGAYRDINTTYSIHAVLRDGGDIDQRLRDMGISFPEYYDTICKKFDAIELSNLLSSSNNQDSNNLPSATLNYEVKPRKVVDPSTIVDDLPAMSSEDLPVLTMEETFTLKNDDSVELPVAESVEIEENLEDIDLEPKF